MDVTFVRPDGHIANTADVLNIDVSVIGSLSAGSTTLLPRGSW
jgi:hypothetical protein